MLAGFLQHGSKCKPYRKFFKQRAYLCSNVTKVYYKVIINVSYKL